MPDYDHTTAAQPFPRSSYRPLRTNQSHEGPLENATSPQRHRLNSSREGLPEDTSSPLIYGLPRTHESSSADASSPRPRRLNRSRESSVDDASPPRARGLDRTRERYPREGSLDELCVERRHVSRDTKGRLAIRHDEMIRRPRQLSRSADPRRRQVTFHGEDQYNSDDSDSGSEYKCSRAVAQRNSDQRLKIIPCSKECNDNPRKANSGSKSKMYHGDSDSDYDSTQEAERLAKHKNRKLLYTGLAGVTTLACANGIYQNTKAYQNRHREVREGEKCTAEVQRLKNKALLMDIFTVGVVAIGLNNVRLGWERVDAINKEGKSLRQR